MRATDIAVSFLSPTTVQVRLELGAVRQTRTLREPPAGIDPADADPESGWIWKDGDYVGRIAPGGAWMGLDRYVKSPLDPLFDVTGPGDDRRAPADDADAWSLAVNGDAVAVDAVARKSAIRDTAETSLYRFDFATTQTVTFDLAEPLSDGDSLSIDFAHRRWRTVEATYDPETTVSEGIHIPLTGFATGDSVKYAFLSSWNGRLLDDAPEAEGRFWAQDFGDAPRFRVIDEATGAVALRGRATLAQDAADGSNFWLNFAQADILALDLSALETPGTYHVFVPGVGRSQSFDVADSHWDTVFATAFSGFYHQRSGIALTEDYTDWTHPRSLHPADGRIVVAETTVRITDASEAWDGSLGKPFDLFPDALTGATLPRAWGGWHDAGDWDRRTQHLEAARHLVELAELAPDWAAATEAAIPENRNRLPDLIDEAIWGARVFARLQTEEGGVRGGIESGAYPGYGSASWLEGDTLYAYAPDPWTSWEFAATAAKIAHAIADIAPKKSARWLDKAERAFDWADANAVADPDEEAGFYYRAARAVAAVELWRATENDAYHDAFLESSSYARPSDGLDYRDWQYEAAFTYATLDPTQQRGPVAERARDAVLDRAAFLLNEGARSGFGNIEDPYAPYGWGNTAQQPTQAAEIMTRAHHLTGEQRYLDAIQADLHYLLGANPQNMAYLTGLDGVRSPETILGYDSDAKRGQVPPGITLYGDYNIYDYGQDFFHELMWPDLWPDPWRTPVHESFQAFKLFVPSTEYTVMQGITDATVAAGYLAAQAWEAEAA